MKKNIVSILLAVSLLLPSSMATVSAEETVSMDSVDKHTYEEETGEKFDEVTEEISQEEKLQGESFPADEEAEDEAKEDFQEPDANVLDDNTQEELIEPQQNAPWESSGNWVLNKTGWWYAYDDGTWPADGITEINGVKYAFDINGYMITGWYQNADGWFYFGESGAMYQGWLLLGKIWYYLDGTDAVCPGRMASDGERVIGGERYFFSASGNMLAGWVLRPEGWYYTDKDGALCNGWITIGKEKYYLDADNEEYPGLMSCESWVEVEGEAYYLTGSGAMASGWLLCPEGWYYLGSDGIRKYGWQLIGGSWYYLDAYNEEFPGLMSCEGFQEIDGATYYLTETGAMATDWLLQPEGWYYLGGDGARKYGWQLIRGSWYYLYQEDDPNGGPCGVMAVSQTIDGWEITESGIAVNDIQGKIAEIKKYIYVPYSYGGNTPKGWDCSGFTQWALSYIGVSIPRSSSQQAQGGVSVDKEDMDQWKPGDILVYSSGTSYNHVALYLGDGLLMHALNAKYGTLIQGVDVYENMDKSNSLALVRRYL